MSDDNTLHDLCRRATWGGENHRQARLNDIERWLRENKDNLSILENNANNRYEWNRRKSTPLHCILRANPPLELVGKILRLAPDATKVQNHAGLLPLHIALISHVSPDVTVNMIFEAYQEATKVKTGRGSLPLHLACDYEASHAVIKMILDEYPKAAEIQDDKGRLPLHIALYREASDLVIDMILEEFPKATEIQDNEGRLPLHIALCYEASSFVIHKILDAYPKATEISDNKGCLPCSIALHHRACPSVMKVLLDVYPKATEMPNVRGKLPLHVALHHAASPDVIKIILDAYPEATKIHDKQGHLPIYYACCLRGTFLCTPPEPRLEAISLALKSLDLVLLAYPKSIDLLDRNGKSPSHLLEMAVLSNDCKPVLLLKKAISCGLSAYVVKLLLKAFPERCKRRDNNRMVPLHYACASSAPHFLEYVMALIDDNHTESFSFQDDQGRTPLQILKCKASTPDEKKRLPLHYLAARTNGLSEKSLKLMVDAYPESISSADKFGVLPFHYACMNQDSSLEVLMLFINFSPELCVPTPGT